MKNMLRLPTLAALLCAAFALPLPALAQSGGEQWVQRYNGPGNGNALVTGNSTGSGSSDDYYTAIAGTARNPSGITYLPFTADNDYNPSQLNAVISQLNTLLESLQRQP